MANVSSITKTENKPEMGSSAGRTDRYGTDKTGTDKDKSESGASLKNTFQDFTENFEEVASKAGEYTEKAKEKVQSLIGNVPNMVRRHPLQSLLIGVGAGFVLAMTLNRTRHQG